MITEEKNYTHERIPLGFFYQGKKYTGLATPVLATCNNAVCFELTITLNQKLIGAICFGRDLHWTMRDVDQGLVNAIVEEILLWYA